METALSTTLGVRSETRNTSWKEMEMSICEYILLIRDTVYPTGKTEFIRTASAGENDGGLGEILIKMNSVVTGEDIRQAVRNYRRAIMKNPADTDMHLKLGISYLLLKDRHSAMQEYKYLKNLDPRVADELLQWWNVKTNWTCNR